MFGFKGQGFLYFALNKFIHKSGDEIDKTVSNAKIYAEFCRG